MTVETRQEPTPQTIFSRVQGRILSGLFLALPFVVTVYVVWFLYTLFRSYVLDPVVWGIQYLEGEVAWKLTPPWWTHYVAPLLALILVLLVLYLLGLFVQSQLYGIVNRLLLRVPVVETVYRAIMNVFEALENQRKGPISRRVVLVEFPQPGMRSLGMVTNSLRDESTGRTILAVCVLTGVMPPSGFTLYVPETEVTDLDWTLNQALQSIISGGITSPQQIRYDRAGRAAGIDDAPAIPPDASLLARAPVARPPDAPTTTAAPPSPTPPPVPEA